MAASIAAEGVLARSTGDAESGVASDHGISLDIYEETGRLTRDKAALCGVFAELRAKSGLEAAVHC